MPLPLFETSERRVYSVSEITRELKDLIKDAYPSLWLRGEISNFKRYPTSGHCYFTLKDAGAQIAAVMFKGDHRRLRFTPQDGMAVIVHGRLNVYEARGQHQILVDGMEPDGVGALQVAFEQLKKKLAAEGLFAAERKRKPPFLPVTVGLLTSPQGAALHDMLTVLRRRFPNVNITLYPVKVQGEGAAEDIARGLDYFSESPGTDVVIVGRGGGSIEDLLAFNDEVVARAVARCRVPVVSAVGHETDYTICDFVADLRAPTPSAAAETVVPVKADLLADLRSFEARACGAMQRALADRERGLAEKRKSLPNPREMWEDRRQRAGELQDDLVQSLYVRFRDLGRDVGERRLRLLRPDHLIREARQKLAAATTAMRLRGEGCLSDRRHALEMFRLKLGLLSPLGVLERGYVLVRRPDGRVVPRRRGLELDEKLRLVFADGELNAVVLEGA